MSGHFKELDGLRGLAAQAVLIAHTNALILSKPEPVAAWFARLAVVFFFVLSGFAIATTVKRHAIADRPWDWFDYTIRRIARIYPPYIVAILSVGAISAFSLSGWTMLGMYRPANEFNTGPLSWLRTLLFLYTGQDAITVVDIAVWSLRVEVALYVIAGLVAAAWFARGIKLFFILACAGALMGLFCIRLFFMVPAFILFSCGAVGALMLAPLAELLPRLSWLGIAVALCLPLALPGLTDDSTMSFIYQAALGVPIALSLILLARSKLADRASWMRFAIVSGNWSYTLYIMHSPVLIELRTLLADSDPLSGDPLRSIGMFILYVVSTNVICWLIALAVERPSYYARVIQKCIAETFGIPIARTAAARDD